MTNGSDAIVEIAGLSIATLGGKRVIDDLSIEILAGENRALVGESGSGKTTLALALMGRIRSGLVHEAGTIFVDGANVLSLKGSSLRRYRAETVSWLSQDPALSLTPHMTVRALLSESVPMDDEDALGLLGRVGLSGVKGLLDRRPRSLSGGQRRRVAIAKAIASKPRVLILDEPTAGLDGATADEVVATIKGICAESGMSVVAITHDLDVAGKFAESVTVLKEGCVLETVSHSELMNNPGTDYARKLVDAQRLERRPGDEMDSSAGAPVFSASSFDVVTPDGKVATRNAAFSINHGRAFGVGQEYDCQGHHGRAPCGKRFCGARFGRWGYACSRALVQGSVANRACRRADGAAGSCDKPQSRALRGHPAFSRRQAGASSLVEERGEGAGLGAFGLGAFARRDQTPAPPLAFGWTGPARCHRPGPRP